MFAECTSLSLKAIRGKSFMRGWHAFLRRAATRARDGEKTGKIDAYIVERTSDNDLWHAYGLKPGKHTLRIVPRGDADSRSRGHELAIENTAIIGWGLHEVGSPGRICLVRC